VAADVSAESPSRRAAIEHYLHTHIPLSKHLGARLIEAGPDAVRISAPLTPNLNHRGTAFGGSLSALAILSGWTWLYVNLEAHGFEGRIVIQSNTMEYVAPADGDFTAVCRAPTAERWDHFRRMLRERGRGRIELDADVVTGEGLVATFHGRYVAVAGGGR
jgi:thioesterase domain-containing protein